MPIGSKLTSTDATGGARREQESQQEECTPAEREEQRVVRGIAKGDKGLEREMRWDRR